MIDEKANPHRLSTAYSTKMFYKGNHACGVNDDPDRVELSHFNSNWPKVDFRLPQQKYDLERVEKLMEQSYQRGRRDNRHEVGEALRELIAF